jgi:hypothetical protein
VTMPPELVAVVSNEDDGKAYGPIETQVRKDLAQVGKLNVAPSTRRRTKTSTRLRRCRSNCDRRSPR